MRTNVEMQRNQTDDIQNVITTTKLSNLYTNVITIRVVEQKYLKAWGNESEQKEWGNMKIPKVCLFDN